MLQAAINAEVEQFLAQHTARVDEQGRRQVVRNGHLLRREELNELIHNLATGERCE